VRGNREIICTFKKQEDKKMKHTRISLKTINGKWHVNNGNIEIAFDTFVDAMYFVDLCYRAVR
jgi:hypothetical protein